MWWAMYPEEMDDQVFEILDKDGDIVSVIAAVPYIREPDIHRFTEGEVFDDKRKQVSAGIRNHYKALADLLRRELSCIHAHHRHGTSICRRCNHQRQ